MNLEYYIIRGRGEGGKLFQLAKLVEKGDFGGAAFKGHYDMERHFTSVDEMKQYIADEVVNKPLSELTIEAIDM